MGSEPDTGFIAVRGNSIVEQAADTVDVFGDRDREQDFVRSDSRLRRYDIGCREAVVVGAAHNVRRSAPSPNRFRRGGLV